MNVALFAQPRPHLWWAPSLMTSPRALANPRPERCLRCELGNRDCPLMDTGPIKNYKRLPPRPPGAGPSGRALVACSATVATACVKSLALSDVNGRTNRSFEPARPNRQFVSLRALNGADWVVAPCECTAVASRDADTKHWHAS